MSRETSLLDRRDCVLVVIDAQEKLMPVIWEQERVADNILKLVKFAGIIGLDVVVTEQQKLGPTLPQIAAEISGLEAIEKITFSCFGCPEFTSRLGRIGKKTLLLTGVESHICVAQTAIAAQGEYRVQVVSDAVSSRANHNWLIALERMRGAGVEITTTEMLIYELLGQAGTGEFKATLPLVK